MTLCGFASTCGRPAGHRGHHGGWKATSPDGTKRLGPAQTRAIVEYLRHGDHTAAAECSGISLHTHKTYVSRAIEATGATSAAQVPVLMGWIYLPGECAA